MSKNCPIFLDYQSGTPCDKRVVEKMLPYFTECFGNPHAESHEFGWKSERALEEAREKIAKLIHAESCEIFFTSGATEASNLAIKGSMRVYPTYQFCQKRHVITCATEHKSVLETCLALKEEGVDVTVLPVTSSGLIDLDQLRDAITPQTGLVSIMGVNNEIGVIQPLKEIGKICREKGAKFHTDCAQAFGRIPLNVDEMHIDLMSLTAHKLYGPKGIGILYVRRHPKVKIKALFTGGGQEKNIRPGTVPVPLCIGFAEAAELAEAERTSEWDRLSGLRDLLYRLLSDELDEIYVNGSMEHRIPANLNLCFFGVEGEALMLGMPDVAVSAGSACTSDSLDPSHVIKALGIPNELLNTAIRFSLGRYTTEEEILFAASRIIETVKKLREISPLWEMHLEKNPLNKVNWTIH